MKKYLLVPVPFVLGTLLSFLFAFKEATHDPESAPPEVTLEGLHYLSFGWLAVGFGLSVVFLAVLLIHDVSGLVEKRIEKRHIRRSG